MEAEDTPNMEIGEKKNAENLPKTPSRAAVERFLGRATADSRKQPPPAVPLPRSQSKIQAMKERTKRKSDVRRHSRGSLKTLPTTAKRHKTAEDEDDETNEQCNSDNSKVFCTTVIEDFTPVVWPILRRIGFKYNMYRGYLHVKIDRCFDNPEFLRRFLCLHGIPNIDELPTDDIDRNILETYVKFAHVPTADWTSARSCLMHLSHEILPDSDIIQKVLPALGFEFRDNIPGGILWRSNKTDKTVMLAPGASDLPRDSLREGLHYFTSLDQVRVYVRSHERLTVTRTRSRKDTTIKDNRSQERLWVRLWGATSKQPLPEFSDSKSTLLDLPNKSATASTKNRQSPRETNSTRRNGGASPSPPSISQRQRVASLSTESGEKTQENQSSGEDPMQEDDKEEEEEDLKPAEAETASLDSNADRDGEIRRLSGGSDLERVNPMQPHFVASTTEAVAVSFEGGQTTEREESQDRDQAGQQLAAIKQEEQQDLMPTQSERQDQEPREQQDQGGQQPAAIKQEEQHDPTPTQSQGQDQEPQEQDQGGQHPTAIQQAEHQDPTPAKNQENDQQGLVLNQNQGHNQVPAPPPHREQAPPQPPAHSPKRIYRKLCVDITMQRKLRDASRKLIGLDSIEEAAIPPNPPIDTEQANQRLRRQLEIIRLENKLLLDMSPITGDE